MPNAAEHEFAAHYFLPEFLQQFLPDRNSIETLLDRRSFSRERRLTLEITLALMLNMVRPGERVGYQKVIDRFFSDTGLAFPEEKIIKPPDKAAFQRAGRKFRRKSCKLSSPRPATIFLPGS